MTKQLVGFGDADFDVGVYVANRPAMPQWQQLSHLYTFTAGDIDTINQACGNGWRKVFNVYSKVLFALPSEFYNFAQQAPSWQQFRDETLLQKHSKTALLFSPPQVTQARQLHIIAGRTHAKNLISQGKLSSTLHWYDDEFAVSREDKIIVCPYFDYRQLSNIKIARLSELVASIY